MACSYTHGHGLMHDHQIVPIYNRNDAIITAVSIIYTITSSTIITIGTYTRTHTRTHTHTHSNAHTHTHTHTHPLLHRPHHLLSLCFSQGLGYDLQQQSEVKIIGKI
jgi:hypothetical protein